MGLRYRCLSPISKGMGDIMQNTKGSLAQQLAEAKVNEEKEKALNGMIDAAAKYKNKS